MFVPSAPSIGSKSAAVLTHTYRKSMTLLELGIHRNKTTEASLELFKIECKLQLQQQKEIHFSQLWTITACFVAVRKCILCRTFQNLSRKAEGLYNNIAKYDY